MHNEQQLCACGAIADTIAGIRCRPCERAHDVREMHRESAERYRTDPGYRREVDAGRERARQRHSTREHVRECARCPDIAQPDRTLCTDCAAERREYSRAYRRRKRAAARG